MIARSLGTLFFYAPGTGIPGFAQALMEDATSSSCQCLPNCFCIDYHVNALNFLYSAGEVERIIFEALNQNTTAAAPVHEIQATLTGQFYRMTYVPAFLFMGLVCNILAALIPLVLALLALRSRSLVKWRKLDTLRLLVDSIEDLRDEPVLQGLHQARNKELD